MSKKITQNVNKDKFFNDLPKVRPEHSQWISKHSNYLSSNLGEIIPIYYQEVLPGQRKKINMGMISHTTTPIAPIFPSMYTELRVFYVPLRLCADLLNGYKDRKSPFVKVFGEDNASASAQKIVPLASQKLPDVGNNFCYDYYNYLDDRITADKDVNTTIFGYLDLVDDDITDAEDDVLAAPLIKQYNFLNLAAYELIYERHYRNENYQAATESDLYKFLFNAYNRVATSSLSSNFTFEKANREKDYFTGMKPFTQKGDPVNVGLLGEADIHLKTQGALNGNYDLGIASGVSSTKDYNLGNANRVNVIADGGTIAGGDIVTTGKLVADLSSATGVSIEELRLMIKTQELLEKDAIYGSRYSESLNAHFGTCPLDLTLQDPQELFKVTITSNMQAIFQTSTTSGEASILGTIGANSTTQTDKFNILPTYEFKEHGILMICAVHKLQNVYDATYWKPKFISKKSRFDFYTPELNDLGYQPVTHDEAKAISGTAGYNEAFAEYRYRFNVNHGLIGQFAYWAPAIGSEYSSAAALYKEDTAILDKALSVRSSTAPQFYDAYGFEEIEDMPMSLHSIPGMDGVI